MPTDVAFVTPAAVLSLHRNDIQLLTLLQGDPSAVPAIVDNVKSLLGAKPMFGICMGHQILGQAVGGSTFKLKFGHHGGNHPIRFDTTGMLCCSSLYPMPP